MPAREATINGRTVQLPEPDTSAPPPTSGSITAGRTAAGSGPTSPKRTGDSSRVAPGEVSGQGWLLPLTVLVVGTFMSALDTSIVNVALPKVQVDLSVSPDDVEWIVTAYTLALGVVVPLTSWLGDRIGQTTLYIAAMAGFAAASALCGTAWDLSSMILFRVLQAIPGGILPVVAMMMLYRMVPPAKIGAANGIYGLGVIVAPAIGPTLGGYLVDYADWRLIFFINVPIGILGAVAAVVVFPRIRPSTWPRFDLWGFVTVAYGLSALLLALSEGDDWGWLGYRILGLVVSGVLSLALFVVIELEVDAPLMNLRVFASWPFTLSIVLQSVSLAGLFTTLFFVPQFLQNVQGLQALDAGLTLAPADMVLLVMVPLSGGIYDRFGPRCPTVVGFLLMAYGSYLLAQLTPDAPTADVELWTSIRNIGTGLALVPIVTSGVAALRPALTGTGSVTNNVMQRVASSVAVAAFSALNTSTSAQMLADRGALYGQGAAALPEVAAAQQQGASGLLALYQAVSDSVTTQAYDNCFYILTLMCAGATILALFMRSGRSAAGTEPVPTEL